MRIDDCPIHECPFLVPAVFRAVGQFQVACGAQRGRLAWLRFEPHAFAEITMRDLQRAEAAAEVATVRVGDGGKPALLGCCRHAANSRRSLAVYPMPSNTVSDQRTGFAGKPCSSGWSPTCSAIVIASMHSCLRRLRLDPPNMTS